MHLRSRGANFAAGLFSFGRTKAKASGALACRHCVAHTTCTSGWQSNDGRSRVTEVDRPTYKQLASRARP